jgi:hypothetical protein
MSMKETLKETAEHLASQSEGAHDEAVKSYLDQAARACRDAIKALDVAEGKKRSLANWWQMVDETLRYRKQPAALLGEVRRYWESKEPPADAATKIHEDRVTLQRFKDGI